MSDLNYELPHFDKNEITKKINELLAYDFPDIEVKEKPLPDDFRFQMKLDPGLPDLIPAVTSDETTTIRGKKFKLVPIEKAKNYAGVEVLRHYVTYPTFDESKFLFDHEIPPWGKKVCNWRRDDRDWIGMGQDVITQLYGAQLRKETDYRHLDDKFKKDKTKFLYLPEIGRYIVLDPEKENADIAKDLWDERTKIITKFQEEAAIFWYKYHDYKYRYIWNYQANSLIKDFNDLSAEKFLAVSNNFLMATRLQLVYLLLIFKKITRFEYDFLIQAIDYMEALNQLALNDLKNENDLERESRYITARQELIRLLTPRNENLNPKKTTDILPGYVLIDSDNRRIVPNLGEIERRNNSYANPSRPKVEQEIIDGIFEKHREIMPKGKRALWNPFNVRKLKNN